jgi:hypothetical protein
MYFVALLFLLLDVLPQSHDGSILAVDFSAERIILAADSRETYNTDDPPDNCKCKIHVIGKGLIFVAGGRDSIENLTTHKMIYDAADVASQVRRDNRTASVETVADLWVKRMGNILAEFAKNYRQALIGGLKKDQPIVDAIFTGTGVDGRISACRRFIAFEVTKDGGLSLIANGSGLGYDQGTFFDHGSASFNEFMAGRTDRARKEQTRVMHEHAKDSEPYLLIAGVKAAILWSNDPEIGGSVDALILHKNGHIEWLQKKKSCHQDELAF